MAESFQFSKGDEMIHKENWLRVTVVQRLVDADSGINYYVLNQHKCGCGGEYVTMAAWVDEFYKKA